MEHAFKLFDAIKHDNKVMINPPNMTHNIFNIDVDFVFPLKRFVRTIDEQDNLDKNEKFDTKDKEKNNNNRIETEIGEIPHLKPTAFEYFNRNKQLPHIIKLNSFKKRL